jgi:tungstate transport system ATP-binding protein
MDHVYQLLNVKKSYEGRTVLDIDSLDIEQGEILAVVGPSGAGKSTLLRLLNFLEYADQGSILFQGQAANPRFPLEFRRQVTTVFQRPALLQGSIESNVTYGLRLRGMQDCKTEVQQVIARMGLDKLRRARARTLSGGESQRVALARAIVLHPSVLLLDEPTANLDPYNIGLIEEVVREINQINKTTIVLVTHNVFQARRLAHRTALMLSGRIVEIESTREFFEQPKDPRTRAFANGEMVY